MKLDCLFNLIKNPEFVKFISVGIASSLVLLGLTVFFTDILHIFYVLSAFFAFEIALVFSFFLHEKWTFTTIQKTTKIYSRFLKFHMFSVFSLIINLSVLYLLTDIFGIFYLYAQGVAILVAFFFNYTASRKITFSK